MAGYHDSVVRRPDDWYRLHPGAQSPRWTVAEELVTIKQSQVPWLAPEEQEIAEERAEALLLAYLTPAQRDEYQISGVIDVPGRNLWRSVVMRIRVNPIARTIEVSRILRRDGQLIARYCVRPVYMPGQGPFPLPLADRVLTLLIWITADPGSFHRIAGVLPV